ncbi:transposase tan1, partial [Pyrenophora tritici-repentis]
KHWMAAFLKRNPRVASVVGRKIEAARAEGATPVQIRAFLELFERTLLASSQKKKAYHQSPENREWASVI